MSVVAVHSVICQTVATLNKYMERKQRGSKDGTEHGVTQAFASRRFPVALQFIRQTVFLLPVAITFNDNVASMCAVEGKSMSPTFNPPGTNASDRVLLDRLSSRYLLFQRGDVVVLR